MRQETHEQRLAKARRNDPSRRQASPSAASSGNGDSWADELCTSVALPDSPRGYLGPSGPSRWRKRRVTQTMGESDGHLSQEVRCSLLNSDFFLPPQCERNMQKRGLLLRNQSFMSCFSLSQLFVGVLKSTLRSLKIHMSYLSVSLKTCLFNSWVFFLFLSFKD